MNKVKDPGETPPGLSRRDFLKYCGLVTATLGLSPSLVPRVAEALSTPRLRPPLIYLQFGECTGCSEALLRSEYPSVDRLMFELLSLQYHATFMAAAGAQAEDVLRAAVRRHEGRFLCVVEGAVATGRSEVYGKIAGRTFLEVARDICPRAAAVVCIGSCACFGGIQAASPNPGGYRGVGQALGIKTVNLAGCPPNPVNFVATVVSYLLLGKLPELDELGRPLFAYAKTVHDQCSRRGHFDRGEFVEEFGSEEAGLGYCLHKMGCKGPQTHNNCPVARFNEGTSWPVQAGHPCIGCSEPGFWDEMPPFSRPR